MTCCFHETSNIFSWTGNPGIIENLLLSGAPARQARPRQSTNWPLRPSIRIYINLEKADDLSLFSRMYSIQELLQIIQLKFNKKITPGKTLIFIDEIQASPAAMSRLRYFYEESPALHVIAAGSLLEVKMKTEGFSFPVGRVEYYYLHPVSFDEFLGALHETESLDYINSIKTTTHIPDDIHTILMKRFHECHV